MICVEIQYRFTIISENNEQAMSLVSILRWPFKSWNHMLGTSIALIGASYISYTVYSQRQFNQPIIGQTIKMLSKDPRVRQLIGYPLSYRYSLANRFSKKDEEEYYSFELTGPKGASKVEMTAKALPVSQIYHYGNKTQKQITLEQQIEQKTKQIDELKDKQSKISRFAKGFKLQIAQAQLDLQQLQSQLQDAKLALVEKKRIFYVPSPEIYAQVSDLKKAQDNTKQLPPDEKLWGVTNLILELPNYTKKTIYPQPPLTGEQRRARIQDPQLKVDVPTINLLHKKTQVSITNLSKDQIVEYGQIKTKFLYSRHSTERTIGMVFTFGLMLAFYRYSVSMNIKSIKGSVLEHLSKRRFINHPQIAAIFKAKGKEPEFDEIIGGGLKGKEFDCFLGVKGLTNGKLHFSGHFNTKKQQYQFSKLAFAYRDHGKKVEIDLLK